MSTKEVDSMTAAEAEISAFLRRQYTNPIAREIAGLMARLGFAAPKRDDTGADWRTCNVDDVLLALVTAYEAGRLAAVQEPQLPPPAAPKARKRTALPKLICHRKDIEQWRARQFSYLQPEEPGFEDRVIESIAHSNASAAVDESTAPKSPRRLEAPISGYLTNVFDTLAEYGLTSVRAASLGRTLYRAEVKRLKWVAAKEAAKAAKQPRACKRCGETGNVEHDADNRICNLCTDAIQDGADPHHFDPAERERSAQRLPAIKSCAACRKAKAINWTCRSCGAKCCEHRCSLKTANSAATCSKCQRAEVK